ncbi:TPA: type IV conjugative transfer system protein TraE [Photobacterium damselae]
MRASNRKDALEWASLLNRWFKITIALLIFLNLTLTGALVYLASNQPRTIAPPTISQEFTVSSLSVSDSYLTMMAEYMLLLKLNVTPENVVRNYQQLLNYVSSRDYHNIQPSFLSEATEIKKEKISSFFTVKAIAVSHSNLTVRVSGKLSKFVGERPLEPENATYLVHFAYPAGVLELKSITRQP